MLIAVVLIGVVGTISLVGWVSWKIEQRWRAQEKTRVKTHSAFWDIINANFWDDESEPDRK